MSYIIKSTSPYVSVKLTQTGRELLAKGQLNFSFWAIGDSEINYVREAIVDDNLTDVTLSASSAVLRPVDRQPKLKTFITKTGSADPYQPINSSNLNVVKAIVNNEAEERGFFSRTGNTFTTLTGSPYSTYSTTIPNTALTGGTGLVVAGLSVGDLILLKISNANIGNATPNENSIAKPYLWFKVQTSNGASITVDRPLPYMAWDSATSALIVYQGGEVYNTIGSGTTTAYWDSGTLSFDANNTVSCSDVPVWNMNNVWCENLAGITGLTTTNLYEDYTKFGSFTYLGTKSPYLEYPCESTAATSTASACGIAGLSSPDDVVKSISIIHYTNNTISNIYGEFFYIANDKYFSLYMPDLMYHRSSGSTASGTTQGMKFIASGLSKTITNTDIEYVELIEDRTFISSALTPTVVGRVYPQLKICVIHDDEIVAATSYKSNRNWTLPPLNASLQAPSGGTSTGVLDVGATMYLTYSLENNIFSAITTPLLCQNYIKITNDTSSPKDVIFKILGTDLLPFMRKVEGGWDGYGFWADTFKLVYQVVQNSSDRPLPSDWKEYDFTTTAITGGAGETINPKLLENQSPQVTGFVLDLLKDNVATTYSLIGKLNMAPNTQPGQLQFGDERFFYGNVGTFIGATIYKTIFDVRVAASDFTLTTNNTRSTDVSTNPPKIKISEVGIYDSQKQLVCIGKLSNPVRLADGTTIMIEVSIDF